MKKLLLVATTALVAACSLTPDYPVLQSVPVAYTASRVQAQEQTRCSFNLSDAIGGSMTYCYVEGNEYEVFVPHGRVVPISLLPGDSFTEIGAVDFTGWRIDDGNSGRGRRNRSVIMVSAIPGEARRLHAVVVGKDHVYLLDLIPRRTGHTAVSFQKKPPRAPSASVPVVVSSYGIKGPAAPWRPISVTDDGRTTTVLFSPNVGATGAPAVMVKGPDGKARPVNSRRIGNSVVVDGVHPVLIMRLGDAEIEAIRG